MRNGKRIILVVMVFICINHISACGLNVEKTENPSQSVTTGTTLTSPSGAMESSSKESAERAAEEKAAAEKAAADKLAAEIVAAESLAKAEAEKQAAAKEAFLARCDWHDDEIGIAIDKLAFEEGSDPKVGQLTYQISVSSFNRTYTKILVRYEVDYGNYRFPVNVLSEQARTGGIYQESGYFTVAKAEGEPVYKFVGIDCLDQNGILVHHFDVYETAAQQAIRDYNIEAAPEDIIGNELAILNTTLSVKKEWDGYYINMDATAIPLIQDYPGGIMLVYDIFINDALYKKIYLSFNKSMARGKPVALHANRKIDVKDASKRFDFRLDAITGYKNDVYSLFDYQIIYTNLSTEYGAPTQFEVKPLNADNFSITIGAPEEFKAVLEKSKAPGPIYFGHGVQIDYRLDQGEWHLTADLDKTNSHLLNTVGFSFGYGQYADTRQAALSELFPGDLSVLQPLIDQGSGYFSNHTITFRARFVFGEKFGVYACTAWSECLS